MAIKASDVDKKTAKIRVNAAGMSFGRKRHEGGKYDLGEIVDLKNLKIDDDSFEEWIASGVIELVTGHQPSEEVEDEEEEEVSTTGDPREGMKGPGELWEKYQVSARVAECPITGKRWKSTQKAEMWHSYDDMEFEE